MKQGIRGKWRTLQARLLSILVTGASCAVLLAQPQVEEFLGSFDAQLGWDWQVPRNTPTNTFSAPQVSFTNEELRIVAQRGTLYQHNNNIRNLPSLQVPKLRGAWRIETRVRLQRNGLAGAYLQAGVVLLRDADNYFNLHLVYLPHQNNWLSVSGGHEYNGSYQWAGLSGMVWNPAEGTAVRLLIRYEPDTSNVRFFYDREDGLHWREMDGSPCPLTDLPALQAVAALGGQVGLYVDTAGGVGLPAPVALFDYLHILSDYHPADVNQDGFVNNADLLTVLFGFGTQRCNQPGDINHDGVVNNTDLLMVLFAFGER